MKQYTLVGAVAQKEKELKEKELKVGDNHEDTKVIPRKNQKRKRILNQTLVCHRKGTYQYQTYTHTRTILCNARRNKVATDKDTIIRILDRRIQILRKICQ